MIVDDLLERLHAPLSRDEVRVLTLDTGDRERVRAITRLVLAPQTGMPVERLEIVRAPKGKPLVGTDPTLHYSVSHSAERAMIALTRVAPLGVDIQLVRTVPNAEAILARFFTPAEIAAILSDDRRDLRFAEAWTRAESRVKARGASVWEAATPDERAIIRAVVPPEGYAASVAVLATEWRVTQYDLPASALETLPRAS